MAKVVKLKNNYIVYKEIISTISSKGQVTLPVKIREFLGLGKNDKVAFVVNDKGNVYVKTPRFPDIASIRGSAGALKKSLTWDEMREIAIEDHIKEDYIDKQK